MKPSDNEIIKKYGHPPVIEAFTPSLDDYFRRSVRSGLGWEMAMLYTVVSNSKGQKFALNRGWQISSSVLWMTSKFDPDITKASPRLFKKMYSGPVKFDLDEDWQMIRIESWPSKHNFKVDIEVGKIHWEEENGAVNLDFNSLGPAMRYTDVGEGGYEGMVETGEMFEVKGTLNGEEVSGFGAIDHDWLPPGIGFVQCKTHTHIEDVWMPWVTRYDDGSIEYGVNAIGAGDWRFGFYVKDGTVIINKDNTIDAKWGDAGGVSIPVEADIQHGDHNFKFVAESRMDIIKGNLNWISGNVINQKKSAAPVGSFCWYEFRAARV